GNGHGKSARGGSLRRGARRTPSERIDQCADGERHRQTPKDSARASPPRSFNEEPHGSFNPQERCEGKPSFRPSRPARPCAVHSRRPVERKEKPCHIRTRSSCATGTRPSRRATWTPSAACSRTTSCGMRRAG